MYDYGQCINECGNRNDSAGKAGRGKDFSYRTYGDGRLYSSYGRRNIFGFSEQSGSSHNVSSFCQSAFCAGKKKSDSSGEGNGERDPGSPDRRQLFQNDRPVGRGGGILLSISCGADADRTDGSRAVLGRGYDGARFASVSGRAGFSGESGGSRNRSERRNSAKACGDFPVFQFGHDADQFTGLGKERLF